MPITTARETTTAMMIDLVMSPDTGLLQLVDCGGPHFPLLQQLFPQSSSVEHDEFSQLSIHFISPSSPQHCFSHSVNVKVYRHCLASTTQTTTKSTHMATKSLFILYRPNSVMILCEKILEKICIFNSSTPNSFTTRHKNLHVILLVCVIAT